MNKIKVSELKEIFEKVTKKLTFIYGEDGEILLHTSVYRLIPTEKWSTFEKPEDWFSASEIDQGDLIDDVLELKRNAADKERIITFVDFDRLASVLREISQIENPI